MTFRELKAYGEDHHGHLCWLQLEPGNAFPMSVESSDRFWAMTNRQLEVHPSRGDLDRSILNQAIRHEYGVLIRSGGKLDRSTVDKMLARAVRRASLKHCSKTRYLPCVVVGNYRPHEFKIGPVRFIYRDKFFAEYGEQIERDLSEKSAEQREEEKRRARENANFKIPSDAESADVDRMTFESVIGYYKSHEWIAEVTIPPCDERVSRERAELVVQAALDILKIFFGSSRARGLRIAREPGVRTKTAALTREEDGRFEWALQYGGERDSALASDGWFDQFSEEYAPELNAAGQAIEVYLYGREPKELATRWLDALNWYGQGVSEPIASAKIVKYVAALERLSITEKSGELTDTVTRRAALFATQGNSEALPKTRAEARELYDWRSALMHGRSSPVAKYQLQSHELQSVMYRGEQLLRSALLGALAVYSNLIIDGKMTDKHLEQRLRELERAFGLVEAAPGRIARLFDSIKRWWRRLFN